MLLFWCNVLTSAAYLIFCMIDDKIKPINDASSIV